MLRKSNGKVLSRQSKRPMESEKRKAMPKTDRFSLKSKQVFLFNPSSE